jgi:hypothetical protein
VWAILNDAYRLENAEISHLYDQACLLSSLMADLGQLASADAGQVGLNLQLTDAARVIDQTVDTLALAAEAQEVGRSTMLPADLPLVHNAHGTETGSPSSQDAVI